jgi:hypothetical protein
MGRDVAMTFGEYNFRAGGRSTMRVLVVEDLLAEIKAIVAWDQDYASRKTHDEVDRSAWEARRIRLMEIQRELEDLQSYASAVRNCCCA